MPYTIPITAVDTALRAQMVASAPLVALLASKPTAKGGGAAIYGDGEVAQTGQLFPYLTIGAWTMVPEHRFSPGTDGYGWNLTVQIKAISQRSEAQALSILSAVVSLFPDGEALEVAGYSSAHIGDLSVVPTLKEITGAVTTYSVPAILRVKVFS